MQSHLIVVSCGLCGGSGLLKGQNCPACRGKGWALANPGSEGNPVECPRCNGSGVLTNVPPVLSRGVGIVQCPYCGGTGWAGVEGV